MCCLKCGLTDVHVSCEAVAFEAWDRHTEELTMRGVGNGAVQNLDMRQNVLVTLVPFLARFIKIRLA